MSMSNFYALMLTEMKARINEMVPEIVYIDQDFGQLDNENAINLAYPCLLIDFTGTTFNQNGQLSETGDASIQMRIGYKMNDEAAAQGITETALAYYELEGKIYKAFKGWNPANGISQPLNRVSDASEKRTDGIRVRKLLFNTMFEDSTASTNYTTTSPRMTIE
ncbi:hypothetical protein GCM10011379_45660 [Filimonas zeae]|uniref:Uncharacterized protein n=2 Tax=Filimonas zeae TaxID=1737353 RepID=A0A917MY46_9BACT|nr:hypothetical protein GCM10011379_45660 [Filimonas zeae]